MQIPPTAAALISLMFLLISAKSNRLPRGTTIAVSYTHLDVYKRQLQYGVRSDTLLARVKVACRYNRFLLDIGRSDKVLYSYSRCLLYTSCANMV